METFWFLKTQNSFCPVPDKYAALFKAKIHALSRLFWCELPCFPHLRIRTHAQWVKTFQIWSNVKFQKLWTVFSNLMDRVQIFEWLHTHTGCLQVFWDTARGHRTVNHWKQLRGSDIEDFTEKFWRYRICAARGEHISCTTWHEEKLRFTYSSISCQEMIHMYSTYYESSFIQLIAVHSVLCVCTFQRVVLLILHVASHVSTIFSTYFLSPQLQ